MYRIIIISLFLFCSVSFSEENTKLLMRQFTTEDIDPYLKEKVPFLQRGFSNSIPIPSVNQYILNFSPTENIFDYFAQITGRNIFKAQFIVSWYIFTNANHIPNSIDRVMELVNQKKPILLKSLLAVNGKWESVVELPYTTLKEESYVFVYVSYPNTQGVLVPIAGQSFYREFLGSVSEREQSLDLNQEMLVYWQKKGYL
ncbi:MAG: hypothetical protein ACRCWI_02900 [Brevinema sp.]